jgi:hypothetical protein
LVAVALLILAVMAGAGAYQVHRGQPLMEATKWLGFGAMTAVAFGQVVHANPQWRRHPQFRVFLGVFLLVHCAVSITILQRVGQFHAFVWATLIGAVSIVVNFSVAWLLEKETSVSRRALKNGVPASASWASMPPRGPIRRLYYM